MLPIRREDDDELCGFVRQVGTRHEALTVFHGSLGLFDEEADANSVVLNRALASMQDRWEFRASPDDEWQPALIQEARPGWVRLLLGYYALPEVPTVDVDFAAGDPAEIRLPQRFAS